MKPQLVIVHGGMVYETKEKYFDALRTMPVDLSWFQRKKKWKDWIEEQLLGEYEIFRPEMPSAQHAKYGEWCLWFERMVPFLREGVVLVGHSLGGIFLAKYLSQHHFPVKVKATILIAAPYNDESRESLAGFCIRKDLKTFEKQGGAIHIWASEDDPVVAITECHQYSKAIPSAHVRTFTDRGHMNQETFPELEFLLRSLL